LLLYVWFEHPGHTYGGFVPSFLERGMTWAEFAGTPPNETGVVVEVEVLAIGELVGWAAYYWGSIALLA
jgi:hypothetical protein